jgi:hypothetical protein
MNNKFKIGDYITLNNLALKNFNVTHNRVTKIIKIEQRKNQNPLIIYDGPGLIFSFNVIDACWIKKVNYLYTKLGKIFYK